MYTTLGHVNTYEKHKERSESSKEKIYVKFHLHTFVNSYGRQTECVCVCVKSPHFHFHSFLPYHFLLPLAYYFTFILSFVTEMISYDS